MSRDESTDPTELFVGMVKAGHDTRDERWSQNLRVEGRSISFKLDTGSDVNIIYALPLSWNTGRLRQNQV